MTSTTGLRLRCAESSVSAERFRRLAAADPRNQVKGFVVRCRQKHIQQPLTSAMGRRGFSLMELLIVLALLVVVGSIAVPGFISRMRDSQLHRAADVVREVLAEARTYAIDSGIDYQFRYEVNGQNFVVLPTEIEPTTSNSTKGDIDTSEYLRLSGTLDETMFLRAMKNETDATDRLEITWFGGLPDAGELAQKAWSSPIYFRFDGSATDRVFRVMDEVGRTAELSVRGLTGAVRLSAVYVEVQ